MSMILIWVGHVGVVYIWHGIIIHSRSSSLIIVF